MGRIGGFFAKALGIIASAVIIIALPGVSTALSWALFAQITAGAFAVALAAEIGLELLGPKAPDTPNLDSSITVTSGPSQYVIGRVRVPGYITDLSKAKIGGTAAKRYFATIEAARASFNPFNPDPTDTSNDNLIYPTDDPSLGEFYTTSIAPRFTSGRNWIGVLYSLAHHECQALNNMYMNGEKFELADPTSFPRPELEGRYKIINLQMPDEEDRDDDFSEKDFRKLADKYRENCRVIFNFDGDNTNNRNIYQGYLGGEHCPPNSVLPLSWALVMFRENKDFWLQPGLGFQPTSVTFDMEGSDSNPAVALRQFLINELKVEPDRIDATAYEHAVRVCEEDGRKANGVWRHTERERIYKSLLEALSGKIAYFNDSIQILASERTDLVFNITEQNLVEPVEHKLKGSLQNYANIAQAQINDEANEWKAGYTGEVRNEAAIEEDEGRIYVNDIGTLRLITNMQQAREYITRSLARVSQFSALALIIYPNTYELEEDGTVTLLDENGGALQSEDVSPDSLESEGGGFNVSVKPLGGSFNIYDRGRVTVDAEGIDDIYRIEERIDRLDGTIGLSLVRDTDSAYVKDESALQAPPVDYTPVFLPDLVGGVTFIDVLTPSGNVLTTMRWTNPASNDAVDIEAWYQYSSEPPSLMTSTRIVGNTFTWTFPEVGGNLRVKIWGVLNNNRDDDFVEVTHIIGSGVSDGPSAASVPIIRYADNHLSITLTLASYTRTVEIRFQAGSGDIDSEADYEALPVLAVKAVAGVSAAASIKEFFFVPAYYIQSDGSTIYMKGYYRIFIRPFDQFGNAGDWVSGIVFIDRTLPLAPEETYQDDQTEWKGTKENLTEIPDSPNSILVPTSRAPGNVITYGELTSSSPGTVFAKRSITGHARYTTVRYEVVDHQVRRYHIISCEPQIQSFIDGSVTDAYTWRVGYRESAADTMKYTSEISGSFTKKVLKGIIYDWEVRVSWSLANISNSWFLKSLRVANIDDLDSKPSRGLEDVNNIDEFEVDGLYSYGQNTPDAPTTNAGYINQLGDSQFATDASTGKSYKRTRIGGSWGSWVEVSEPVVGSVIEDADDATPGTIVSYVLGDEAGLLYTWELNSVINFVQTTTLNQVFLGVSGLQQERTKVGTNAWSGWSPVDIPDGAITATKIADDSISTPKIKANAITANLIAASAVVADKLAANAVTTSKLSANAVTAAKIASNTITANQIKAGTITSDEIKASTITSNEMAADSITADELAAGAVTADAISVGTITADRISSNVRNVVVLYTYTGSNYPAAVDRNNNNGGTEFTCSVAWRQFDAIHIVVGVGNSSNSQSINAAFIPKFFFYDTHNAWGDHWALALGRENLSGRIRIWGTAGSTAMRITSYFSGDDKDVRIYQIDGIQNPGFGQSP